MAALLALVPPAEGNILIIPVVPVRAEHSLVWALPAGALLMGNGFLPGSYVVRGSRSALLGPALANGALLLSAPAAGCFSTEDPNDE